MEEQRQRVHHSYIWLGSLRSLGWLLFVLIIGSFSSLASLFATFTSGPQSVLALALILGLVIGGVIVLFGLVVGIHAWAYRHLWYELGPEEFSLYSGIFTKKRMHVPYAKIQSVDQKASLIQRIFGVCNISIDTAGGATNNAILVPYLTKQQADTLRLSLYTRKQQAAAPAQATTEVPVAAAAPGASPAVMANGTAGAAVANGTVSAAAPSAPVIPGASGAQGNILDTGEVVWDQVGGIFAGDMVNHEPVSFEYRLSNKELILTGLSNSSGFVVAVIVVLVGLAQLISGAFDIFPESGELITGTLATSSEIFGLEAVIAVSALALLVVALVVWLLSVLNACLSYGGFHARRRGGRIEIERGLLQHQTQSVSIDRIQSVIMKQTFVRKLMGYCELSLGKVDAASPEEQSNQGRSLAQNGIVIHPFLKKASVQEILDGLVPEFADIPTDEQKLAKAALRRGLIRRCLWQGGGFWILVVAVLLLAGVSFAQSEGIFSATVEDLMAVYYLTIAAYLLIGLGVLLLVLDAVRTVLWYRESSFAVNRRFMRLANGGLSTESITFPRVKIQYGFTKANPLQRRAKTATINACTAAGVGGSTASLVDVTEAAASTWLEWLKPRRPQG